MGNASYTPDLERKNAVEKAWLFFFNNRLLEAGLITADEHRRMAAQIHCRRPGDNPYTRQQER